MIVVLFWITLSLIVYTYFGYPLLISLLQRFKKKSILRHPIHPFVSVVIAVHNGESSIKLRLKNLLDQDYPKDKLEIIVVSDGSIDRTVELAEECISECISVYSLDKNHGKAVALNYGVAKATGELIVFTDARQEFESNVITKLVANFADESVGCVSGELHFLEDPDSNIEVEMGAYWKYEKFIRRSESASGFVIGATGCIYAIRFELYQPLPAGTILDDVLTPMNIARSGKKVLFEAEAVAYDIISKNTDQEWTRKVRTLAGNWQLFNLAPWILLPWSNPLWFRYVSHKLLRLLVPFGMVMLLVDSLLLPGTFFRIFTLLQLVFYGLALAGLLLSSTRSNRMVKLIYFFMVMNAAAVAGFWKWATGGCATAWQAAYSGKETSRG
jgi:cellulose synthase/poly-beta-1,6-N-acetylglucosamine synthase-like glycosyltransferase